jgi:hypothetical protein
MRTPAMQAKIVRFTTRTGVVRQGRVTEEYLLHGRLRYTVETEFGDVFVYADETENVTPQQPAKMPPRPS